MTAAESAGSPHPATTVAAAARRALLLGALLFAAATLVCLPALHGDFVSDDPALVSNNPLVTQPGGWWRIWFTGEASDYYPLTWSLFRVEHALFGADTTGYHVVNFLLHGAACVLLWRVLLRLRVPGAWFAALLFSVHPLVVTSVAWISETKNTLSLALAAGAALAWLAWLSPQQEGSLAPVSNAAAAARQRGTSRSTDHATATRNPRLWWTALLLFLLALLAKTSVVLLPLVLLCCAWLLRRLDRRVLLAALPLLALSVAAAALTVAVQHGHTLPGPVPPPTALDQRLHFAGRGAAFYLRKTFWPTDLMLDYARFDSPLVGDGPGRVASDALLIAALAIGGMALLALAWRARERWGRAVLLAVTAWLALLAPVLGVIEIRGSTLGTVADHYVYPALIAPLALGAGWAGTLLRRLRRPAALRSAERATAAAGLALAGLLGAQSWARADLFRDQESLFRSELLRNEASWIAHNNVGVADLMHGRFADAERHFRRAADINPHAADALQNLGLVLRAQGRLEDAVVPLQRSIAQQPDITIAHLGLAEVFMALGRPAEAEPHFRRVLEMQPASPGDSDSLRALQGLGAALAQQQHFDAAEECYRRLVAAAPQDAEGWNNLGGLLARRGARDEAEAALRRALLLKPGYDKAERTLRKLRGE